MDLGQADQNLLVRHDFLLCPTVCPSLQLSNHSNASKPLSVKRKTFLLITLSGKTKKKKRRRPGIQKREKKKVKRDVLHPDNGPKR